MAEDVKLADRKTQPRFSQFALSAARDTSAFEPSAAAIDERLDEPGLEPELGRTNGTLVSREGDAAGAFTTTASKGPRSAKAPSPPPEVDEELISFTVRLPASLYMRMRRSLGLRERLGELCVMAITRELDLRS